MSREIEPLLDEVRLVWHALVRKAEEMHRNEEITLAMRAVLEFLMREGPTPVPGIARSRGVTRQHIQTTVNALQEKDLVATSENPAHKRSQLIVLTRNGAKTIERMLARERRFYDSVAEIPSRDVGKAVEVLRTLRLELQER